MFFHRLQCDTCAETIDISFSKIPELHNRYAGQWNNEYEKEVENLAGACKCGGKFLFGAPPRCPKCRSLKMEHVPGVIINYD